MTLYGFTLWRPPSWHLFSRESDHPRSCRDGRVCARLGLESLWNIREQNTHKPVDANLEAEGTLEAKEEEGCADVLDEQIEQVDVEGV